MYVTRFLSLYRNFPDSLSKPPAEGPNSGCLIILDKEAESTIFFGLFKDGRMKDLPFPQNKKLTILHSSGSGKHQSSSQDDVILIPVINQPLSSNRYYAIKPHRKHKGEAYVSSKDEDMATCLCCNYVRDVKPRPFDSQDIYQQFEIFVRKGGFNTWGGFSAKSVASDGYPPTFLQRTGWTFSTKTSKKYELGEASGTDNALRARLPDFNFAFSCKSSERVVVGKWYCPFMFIRDGALQDQVDKSMYYGMTLEQNWEQIYAYENDKGEGNRHVSVDIDVQREVVLVGGREMVNDKINVDDGVTWFRSYGDGGGEIRVGLSCAIVERMKWEEERVGWIDFNERKVRVKREEKFEGNGGWKKFGCYVLVERFVLKRMDGSLVLTYHFKHTHKIRFKRE